MALRAVPDHPKFAHLKSLLRLPKGAALGYLEATWHFAARFTPRGNIGKYPDAAIESWMEWDGESGALIRALVESGWLHENRGFRLVVHDWSQHADEMVNTNLARRCETFWDGRLPKAGRLNQSEREKFREWSANSQPAISHRSANLTDRSASAPKPEPEPEPEPETPSAAETAAAVHIAEETFDLSDEERNGALNVSSTAKKFRLSPEVATVLDQVAPRIHGRHPAHRRCSLSQVKKLLGTIAGAAPAPERAGVLHAIDRNHATWCASDDWRKEAGQYVKSLDAWLAPKQGRWNNLPASASADVADREPPKLMM